MTDRIDPQYTGQEIPAHAQTLVAEAYNLNSTSAEQYQNSSQSQDTNIAPKIISNPTGGNASISDNNYTGGNGGNSRSSSNVGPINNESAALGGRGGTGGTANVSTAYAAPSFVEGSVNPAATNGSNGTAQVEINLGSSHFGAAESTGLHSYATGAHLDVPVGGLFPVGVGFSDSSSRIDNEGKQRVQELHQVALALGAVFLGTVTGDPRLTDAGKRAYANDLQREEEQRMDPFPKR